MLAPLQLELSHRPQFSKFSRINSQLPTRSYQDKTPCSMGNTNTFDGKRDLLQIVEHFSSFLNYIWLDSLFVEWPSNVSLIDTTCLQPLIFAGLVWIDRDMLSILTTSRTNLRVCKGLQWRPTNGKWYYRNAIHWTHPYLSLFSSGSPFVMTILTPSLEVEGGPLTFSPVLK